MTKTTDSLLRENDILKKRVKELEETFRHYHVSRYEDGKLQENCADCGLNIRDGIHKR